MSARPATRARIATVVAGFTGVALAFAASDPVVIENWSADAVGSTTVPTGWSQIKLPFRTSRAEFLLTTDDARRALLLKSHDEHTVIAKPLRVDLAATPVLEWSWKLSELPSGADLRDPRRSDSAAVLLVSWGRARSIGYAWDAIAPAGSQFSNPRNTSVSYVVVRSGTAQLNTWLDERRNVADDYVKLFGGTPAANPDAISISIDTNDTHSKAVTMIGEIRFRRTGS
jgi:Protein of unknown function (DUF3047)